MQVVEFLKQNNKNFSLLNERGINTKHYEREGLVVLSYNMLVCKKSDPLGKECRGLILNHNLKVVCRPFDRFFNYGEQETDKLDFEGFTYRPKLDGSLIKIYHYGGAWRIAGRGTAFGEDPARIGGEPLSRMVLSLLNPKKEISDSTNFQEVATKNLNPDLTYIYEFTTPEICVIRRYETPKLTFLAARDNENGNYVEPSGKLKSQKNGFVVNSPEETYLTNISIEEVLKKSRELKNLDEGYVGYDRFGAPKVKIKSPMYVTTSLIGINGFTKENCAKLVASGDLSEYLTYYPENKEIFEPYNEAKKIFIKDVLENHEKFSSIEDKRDFAMAIINCRGKNILFESRKLGISPEEMLRKINVGVIAQNIIAYM